MCPKHQAGIGLPVALFIIVILSMLVGALLNLQESDTDGLNYQVQSVRAQAAAESGMQAFITRVVRDSVAGCSAWNKSFSQGTHALVGCRFEASCSSMLVSGERYYDLRVAGFCGSGLDEASRALEARIR